MNSKLIRTTAVSLGLATILTFTAVAPSFASTHKSGKDHSSIKAESKGKSHSKVKHAPSSDHSAVVSVSVPFTVTNVPVNYADAQTLAHKLVFKVVKLAADATEAPATAPVDTSKKDEGHSNAIENDATFVLANSTLTGELRIRADKVAGVSNYAIYPMIAADSVTGLASQAGTPVFVSVTTAADLTASVTVQSGPVTLDLALNTGTLVVI